MFLKAFQIDRSVVEQNIAANQIFPLCENQILCSEPREASCEPSVFISVSCRALVWSMRYEHDLVSLVSKPVDRLNGARNLWEIEEEPISVVDLVDCLATLGLHKLGGVPACEIIDVNLVVPLLVVDPEPGRRHENGDVIHIQE